MKKIKMNMENGLNFEEGFDDFILYCKQNNFRKDTIKHYEQAYRSIEKYIPYNTPLESININVYNGYILFIKEFIDNEQTVLSYMKDFNRIINYFIKKEYIPYFKTTLPKTDNKAIETYSDEDLEKLLKKPNLKKCDFSEYRNWVIVNFFLSTGVRLSSLTNIKIRDLDLDNNVVNIMHTKNRKPLIIPLNKKIVSILKEYVKQRQGDRDEYLFCTVWEKQMTRICIGTALREYNKRRGVLTTGIHRLRHTFAKKWILGGNSVVSLRIILGHRSLETTQNYVNMLVSDIGREVDAYNILQEFDNKLEK